jgi:hypothetical protein
MDLRWKRLERTVRSMPKVRQEELLAVAQAVLHLPEIRVETRQPRAIGPSEEPEVQGEDQPEDWESTRSPQRGT